MVDEKIDDKENVELEKKPEKKQSQESDEKYEIDLRELQIKLEKIKGYIVKTDGRVKKHEKELEILREKMLEIESKRQSASVLTRHKLVEDR